MFNNLEYQKKRRLELISKGVCTTCAKNPTHNNTSYCNECRLKKNTDSRLRDKEKRLRCFEAYGGAFCACCGETQYEFLSIDHINNDGAEHRKTMGGEYKRNAGSRISRWLVKNNFPPGFQVLCHNCNAAKGFYGECPHKKFKVFNVQTL